MLWIDAAAIPKDAPNPDAAHRFLDFMMEPKVAAASSTLTALRQRQPPGDGAARQVDLGESRGSIRRPDDRARFYTISAANAEQTRERTRLWTTIKTGR